MPVRATARGAERTHWGAREADVLICGASFAGLAVARELAHTGADVLVLDRYEIGDKQTSACAAPTEWLVNLGLEHTILQTFDELVVHTRSLTRRWSLPWRFSTFDYRAVCESLWADCGEARFEFAKVDGRTGDTVHTDRGDVTAPVVVDALGWRRVLSNDTAIQPPNARLSRGLEVHPSGNARDLELWIDRAVIRAGYGWSFPAAHEVRVGVGSFDPHDKVKEPTVDLVERVGRTLDGYQGNWIPHQIRPATDDGVFFVGDSAGHCLPLSAEGIRTALYFGIALGRELRAVAEGRQDVTTALRRYHEFSDEHAWKFAWLLRVQHLVPRLHPRLADLMVRAFADERLTRWAFAHYLDIAPPQFALADQRPAQGRAGGVDRLARARRDSEPAPEAVDRPRQLEHV
jgi:menaquinone-9 beta-reductase